MPSRTLNQDQQIGKFSGQLDRASPDNDVLQAINTLQVQLLANPESTEPFADLVVYLAHKLKFRHCSIVRFSQPQFGPKTLASTGSDEYRVSLESMIHNYKEELLKASDHDNTLASSDLTVTWHPITYAHSIIGGIVVEQGDNSKATTHVLNMVCSYLGDTLISLNLSQQNRRHDLYEERAAISRELHDSLAQSLTYLKIQASRLQALLSRTEMSRQSGGESIDNVLSDLRENISTAYQQLRDLMTTFRLTMHGKTFNDAVDESVQEFGARSTIAFKLDNRLPLHCLDVDEEMQVLKIIREALSNIVRHSHASRAALQLWSDNGRVFITIEDDGVGTSTALKRAQHHGLIIMQERIQNLDGNFQVVTADMGGTKITASFVPNKT